MGQLAESQGISAWNISHYSPKQEVPLFLTEDLAQRGYALMYMILFCATENSINARHLGMATFKVISYEVIQPFKNHSLLRNSRHYCNLSNRLLMGNRQSSEVTKFNMDLVVAKA